MPKNTQTRITDHIQLRERNSTQPRRRSSRTVEGCLTPAAGANLISARQRPLSRKVPASKA